MLRAVQRAVVLPVAPPYHRLTHPYHPPCGAGGGAAGRQGRRPQSCGPQTRRRQSGAAAPPAWSAAHAHWAAQVAGQGGCRVTMNAPGRLHKPAQTDAAAQARCPDSTTHAQRSPPPAPPPTCMDSMAPPLRRPMSDWLALRTSASKPARAGQGCEWGTGKGASGAQWRRVRHGTGRQELLPPARQGAAATHGCTYATHTCGEGLVVQLAHGAEVAQLRRAVPLLLQAHSGERAGLSNQGTPSPGWTDGSPDHVDHQCYPTVPADPWLAVHQRTAGCPMRHKLRHTKAAGAHLRHGAVGAHALQVDHGGGHHLVGGGAGVEHRLDVHSGDRERRRLPVGRGPVAVRVAQLNTGKCWQGAQQHVWKQHGQRAGTAALGRQPRAHLLSAGLAVTALWESTSTSSLHQDTCRGRVAGQMRCVGLGARMAEG